MTRTPRTAPVELVVVGSVALDTIQTASEHRTDILGGSAPFACAAASRFCRTGMVGIVGTDFPRAYRELAEELEIDLEGLQVAEGKTFRWSGVYEDDMINRRTISTDLNVFESFLPELPDSYRKAPFILLGNIAPQLQERVLDQAEAPRFVAIDTMDLWIQIAREDLIRVISRCDLITLNDGEARQLTGEHDLPRCAAALLDMGPGYVVIKKGEHGALLFGQGGTAIVPAVPLSDLCDPTGAGDSYVGALMGELAKGGVVTPAAVRSALWTGSVLASFTVESFSLDRLAGASTEEVVKRRSDLEHMASPTEEVG